MSKHCSTEQSQYEIEWKQQAKTNDRVTTCVLKLKSDPQFHMVFHMYANGDFVIEKSSSHAVFKTTKEYSLYLEQLELLFHEMRKDRFPHESADTVISNDL